MGTSPGRCQRPCDHAPHPQCAPAIGELLVGFDDQDFTLDDAIPIGHGGGAKTKSMAHRRLEVVIHQPFLDQSAFRESAPDFFRRVRHFSFHHDGARSGWLMVHSSIVHSPIVHSSISPGLISPGLISHGSILLSKSSRRSKRSCQKRL